MPQRQACWIDATIAMMASCLPSLSGARSFVQSVQDEMLVCPSACPSVCQSDDPSVRHTPTTAIMRRRGLDRSRSSLIYVYNFRLLGWQEWSLTRWLVQVLVD